MTAFAAVADLPAVLNPAALLPPRDEMVPNEVRKDIEAWVVAQALDGLEAAALAAAGAEPAAFERHRLAYAHGRQIAERGRNGHQWWLGEMWATAAAAALGFTLAPGTHAYRALCHDALRGVVRAHAVHEARMTGAYDNDPVPAPRPMGIAPAAPGAVPPLMAGFPARTPQQVPRAPARQEAEPAPNIAARAATPVVAAPAVVDGAAGSVPATQQPTGRNRDLHLEEAFEITRKSKTKTGSKDGWQCAKTVDQARKALALFMAVTGLTHVSQVTRGHVLDFRDRLCELPSLKGRSIYSGMDDLEQIALADQMEALKSRAKCGDKTAQQLIAQRLEGRKVTIDAVCARATISTINRYLSQVAAIFEEPLDDAGRVVEHPAFRAVQYKRDKGRKGHVTPTRTLSTADLEAIFETPKFQVEVRKKSDRFWGFLLIGLLGLRRGEVAQLSPEDFDFTGSVPMLSLDHATKQLKSEAGERVLPVPSAALDFGVKETVQKALRAKRQELFPAFAWKDNEMERGRDLTRWFADVLDEAGVRAPGKSLKSLRKNFNTDLTRSGCNDAARHYLMGHAHDGVNLEHYFAGFRPDDVAPYVEGTRFEAIVRRCLLNDSGRGGNVLEFMAAA